MFMIKNDIYFAWFNAMQESPLSDFLKGPIQISIYSNISFAVWLQNTIYRPIYLDLFILVYLLFELFDIQIHISINRFNTFFFF